MRQEEKQLLLKDLCARLPYGVMVHFEEWNPEKLSEVNLDEDVYNGMGGLPLPYLRSMSSMTEEEENELVKAAVVGGYNDDSVLNSYIITDWLNAHYFDFRNLIGKGLAIDCTDLNIY